MNRTELDGVPVLWASGLPPMSAGLVFGVGRRDESFVEGGLTHLVEHLVMSTLPTRRLECNASVSTGATEFRVTGRPEQVVQFLDGVCAALRELPLDRLATERRVLAAEDASSGAGVVDGMLLTRYGAGGLGLMGMAEPALEQLTGEQVEQHVRRFFTAGNAALWLTDPVPEGLRLALPEGGPRPPRPPQQRLPLHLPAQQRYPGPDVAMSVELPASEAALATARIARDRMEDELRHRGGHSYCVDFVSVRIDEQLAHLTFIADGAPKELPSVARGMWNVLQALAEQGGTPQELADDLEGATEHAHDPRAVEDELFDAAQSLVHKKAYLSPEERLAALRAVTPDTVAALIRDALPSLLVLVPEEAAAVLPEVPELPQSSQTRVQGDVAKARWRGGMPRGAELVHGPTGVTLVLGRGVRTTVEYDRCVGMGVGDVDHRHLELVGHDGVTVPVCEQDWRGGGAVLDAVERAVSDLPRFRIPVDEEA